MAAPLTRAVRFNLKARAWKLSLDGWNVTKIAGTLAINPRTARKLLIEGEQDMAAERKFSGEAEADLNRYIGGMRALRAEAMNIYAREINRLEAEEALEAEHSEARAREGKLPTVMVTRALQTHFSAMPVALKALDTAMRTVEHEGRVLRLGHPRKGPGR